MAYHEWNTVLSTAASSTTTYPDVIEAGTIKRVEVQFPSGCEDLVQVQITIGGVLTFPRSGYIAGNDETISITSEFPVSTNQSIVITVVNTDDTYVHNPLVRMDIQEPTRNLSLTDGNIGSFTDSAGVTPPGSQIVTTQQPSLIDSIVDFFKRTG